MIPASEVESIIAAAVDRQVKAALEKAMAAAPKTSHSEMAEFTEKLALAINSVNDQKGSQKPVPPEELARRAKAKAAMEALIEETYQRGAKPLYKLTGKMYLGEQLRRARPVEIGWSSVPNQHMEPINDEAKAIMALFMESIGGQKLKAQPVRVTAGGLVVRSGGMSIDGGRDSAPRVGRDDLHFRRDEPTVVGRGSPMQAETRILGTVMPAARHSTPL
jgi:hypothetical protein